MKTTPNIRQFAVGALLCGFPMAVAYAQSAATLHVHLVPQGVRDMKYGYTPIRHQLSSVPPSGLVKAPTLVNPNYGVLTFGPAGSETSYIVIVDQPNGDSMKVYFDANHDGDLTNDPAVNVTMSGQSRNCYFWVEAPQFGKHSKVRIGGFVYPGKPGDPIYLNYFADYAWLGTANLGGKTYKAGLFDVQCVADFSRPPAASSTVIQWGRQYDIWIDRNQDEAVSPQERFNAAKPFNVGGTTYEVKNWPVDPIKLELGVSSETVAEQPLWPKAGEYKDGAKFVAIDTKSINDQRINLSTDYKGKVVLVDFWATWCGPCMAEVPNVVKNYQAYKEKGFDVLGVSLDQPNSSARVIEVAQSKGMLWPEIYEGKYWDVSYVKKLGIQAIPQAYLIDGTTGKILAQGEEIRGEKLPAAIEKALAARK